MTFNIGDLVKIDDPPIELFDRPGEFLMVNPATATNPFNERVGLVIGFDDSLIRTSAPLRAYKLLINGEEIYYSGEYLKMVSEA